VLAAALWLVCWILAPLRKRQFFSLAELNAAIAGQLRLVMSDTFVARPSHAATCSRNLNALRCSHY
jgi:hypothetical protein